VQRLFVIPGRGVLINTNRIYLSIIEPTWIMGGIVGVAKT